MIEVNNIIMEIDNKKILNNVSFELEDGKILGIIGQNGAGKTTLIKCLTGIYKPTKGDIYYDGEGVFDNPHIKSLIGYVQDENNFFSNFKIRDIKKYYKYGYTTFDEEKFYRINKIFNIPLDKRIFQLSKGMKMRVSILFALSIGAKFLILDEPTSGLDVIFKKKFFNLIREEVRLNEVTVIISSHHLNDLENFCDDILIINDGKNIYNDSLKKLGYTIKKIQIAFDRPIYEEDFSNIEEIFSIKKVGRVFTIVTKDYSKNFIEKIDKLKPIFMEELELTLEDMFIYTVRAGGENE